MKELRATGWRLYLAFRFLARSQSVTALCIYNWCCDNTTVSSVPLQIRSSLLKVYTHKQHSQFRSLVKRCYPKLQSRSKERLKIVSNYPSTSPALFPAEKGVARKYLSDMRVFSHANSCVSSCSDQLSTEMTSTEFYCFSAIAICGENKAFSVQTRIYVHCEIIINPCFCLWEDRSTRKV